MLPLPPGCSDNPLEPELLIIPAVRNGKHAPPGLLLALPTQTSAYPPRPRSGLSFNFCLGGKKGLSAEEQRTLACVPLRPFEIKEFAKQVQRRKKNKAELKAEFLVINRSLSHCFEYVQQDQNGQTDKETGS